VAQINNLVREAMGFSKDRGDTLNVTNSPFDGVDKPVEPEVTIAWWRDPDLIAAGKHYGRILLGLLLVLLVFFKILRPMLRPLFRRLDEISAVPDGPVRIPSTPEQEQAQAARTQMQEMEAGQGDGYRDNLNMAKKLSKEDPRVVANVVKAWVGANE
jgi:flagellar M-ring protein FliF